MIKEKGLTQKAVLNKCGINENGCSVDSLLGRTDKPNFDYSINGSHNVQAVNDGNNSQITVTSDKKQDDTTEEILELIQSLPLLKRAEAVLYLNSMKNET